MPRLPVNMMQDTAAGWATNDQLPPNWVGVETDTGRMKQGDGVTAWGSLPYVAGGGREKIKSADETRTANTTLTADTDLQFNMEASKNYKIIIDVFWTTSAAGDFKFSLSGPAAPTSVRIVRRHIDPSALTTLAAAFETAYTSSTAVAAGAGTDGWVQIELTVQNGVNAGAFAFNWAQNTSDAGNTLVRAGSSLRYRTF